MESLHLRYSDPRLETSVGLGCTSYFPNSGPFAQSTSIFELGLHCDHNLYSFVTESFTVVTLSYWETLSTGVPGGLVGRADVPYSKAVSLPQPPWVQCQPAALCCMSPSFSPPFTPRLSYLMKKKNLKKKKWNSVHRKIDRPMYEHLAKAFLLVPATVGVTWTTFRHDSTLRQTYKVKTIQAVLTLFQVVIISCSHHKVCKLSRVMRTQNSHHCRINCIRVVAELFALFLRMISINEQMQWNH